MYWRRAGVDRNSNQTLVTRTHDLIRSLATFASRQLGGMPGGLSSLTASTPSFSLAGSAASPAGRSSHPLRFPKRKQNAPTKNNIEKKKQAIPKMVLVVEMKMMETWPITNMPLK